MQYRQTYCPLIINEIKTLKIILEKGEYLKNLEVINSDWDNLFVCFKWCWYVTKLLLRAWTNFIFKKMCLFLGFENGLDSQFSGMLPAFTNVQQWLRVAPQDSASIYVNMFVPVESCNSIWKQISPTDCAEICKRYYNDRALIWCWSRKLIIQTQ